MNKTEAELGVELENRDNAEEWADQLANDISACTGIEIGEHSNMTNPWQNTLDAVHRHFDECKIINSKTDSTSSTEKEEKV